VHWTTVLGLAFALVSATHAVQPMAPDDAAHGMLDGMRFVGHFGPTGGPDDRADALSFVDGHFWSSVCVPCGFLPASYWVRRVDDAIHFRGEMGSVERGRFHYHGVIRGQRLSASVNWRKERWYWSIDRDLRFEGTLAESPPAAASLADLVQRARRGAVAPEPDAVCPL
jgi:hypothetical protein